MALPAPTVHPDWLPVRDTAAVLGVSPRRVTAMVAAGVLVGRRRGRRWEISRGSVAARMRSQARPVRPISSASLQLLKDALEVSAGRTPSPEWLRATSRDRARATQRADRLRRDPHPASLLRAWVGPRHDPSVREVRLPRHALDAAGAAPTGISHPASGIDAADQVEVQVERAPAEVEPGAADELVTVRMHVRPGPVRLADVTLDLSAHAQPREDS